MWLRRLLILILGGSLLPLWACEKQEDPGVRPTFYDKAEQASQNGAGAPVVLPPQRQAFERSVEERLAQFDQSFASLQEEAAQLPAAAGAEMAGELETLRHQRELAREQLADLRDAGTETWNRSREEMQTSLAELEQALRDLQGRLEQRKRE